MDKNEVGPRITLKQTQRLKGRVTRTMIQDRMMRIRTIMRMGPRRTLKQTQRLKGRVTRTMIQNGMKILDKYDDGEEKIIYVS